MARPARYDVRTKAAILKAAHDARESGGKFKDAFTAATAAGYNGTQGGLYQMLLAASGRKRKTPAAKATPQPVVAKRGPGRPKGTVSNSFGSSIEAAVNAEVNARIKAEIARAIQALEAYLG